MATSKTVTQESSDVNLTVRLPKTVDRAVALAALDMDTTKQQVVEAALREFLKLGAK